MKKVKLFRNYIANLSILCILIVVIAFSYMGGVLDVFSSNSSDAIYHGNTKNKNVSIMINVYWGTEYIDSMLDILKDKKIKATFFIGGCWASNNSDTLMRIFEEGHELGNHGYFHKDHKNISFEKNQEEIYLTHKLIKEYTGVEMSLFAPPSGSYNNNTLSVAYELGYKTIMWSKDTIDWRDKNTKLIYKRATSKPSNGDLILMHPTFNTVEALSDIIDFYQNSGFKLVSVTENIS